LRLLTLSREQQLNNPGMLLKSIERNGKNATVGYKTDVWGGWIYSRRIEENKGAENVEKKELLIHGWNFIIRAANTACV